MSGPPASEFSDLFLAKEFVSFLCILPTRSSHWTRGTNCFCKASTVLRPGPFGEARSINQFLGLASWLMFRFMNVPSTLLDRSAGTHYFRILTGKSMNAGRFSFAKLSVILRFRQVAVLLLWLPIDFVLYLLAGRSEQSIKSKKCAQQSKPKHLLS